MDKMPQTVTPTQLALQRQRRSDQHSNDLSINTDRKKRKVTHGVDADREARADEARGRNKRAEWRVLADEVRVAFCGNPDEGGTSYAFNVQRAIARVCS